MKKIKSFKVAEMAEKTNPLHFPVTSDILNGQKHIGVRVAWTRKRSLL